jgi:putative transposase
MPAERTPGKPTTRRYSDVKKAQAVRLVRQLRAEVGSDYGTVKRVAAQLGYGIESVRSWVRQADIDEGVSPGTTTAEAERIKRLEQENREFASRERDPEARVGFLRGGARPPTEVIVEFIDANRDEFGVEPICTVLQVAPSTYYATKSRPLSARSVRDAVLIPVLVAIWTANYRVYGAHKLWKAARRAGHEIGRDQVARLMRAAGIHGVSRRRRLRTTRPDPTAPRPADLVKRNFTATAPNQLWVTDVTYVATWSGVAYVCFIVDAFSRMIVGWRVAAQMRTGMVLDALEMSRWSRGTVLEDLVAHSDAGSQFTSIRYGERLAELGAQPSIGSVGDSYDNALAEK